MSEHVRTALTTIVEGGTLTLDEAIVLYEVSGLTLDQVGELPDGAFNPGFIKAMLYIAIQRAEPQTKRKEIEEVLGKIQLAEMDQVFVAEEDVADPPIEPQTGNVEPPGSSGESGTAGSRNGQDYANLASTGAQRSLTTSQGSPRPTSEG